MKSLFISLLVVCVSLFSCPVLTAQRDLTPSGKRKSSAFGKADYKDYEFYGMQYQLGPTFMAPRSNSKNLLYSTTDATGRPINYLFDPASRVGFFAEVGMAHFVKTPSKFAQKLKYAFVSYYDWGLGVKVLGGKETTKIDYKDVMNNFLYSAEGEGKFYNAHVYGRFAAHKNFYFGKKYFLDNALGFNFDYTLFPGNKSYEGVSLPQMQSFYKPFVWQLHYDIGLGVKLSRRSFFIPGVQLPLLGMYSWRGGCGALHWYSSNYVPILFHVKLIRLFEKKSKGCPPAKGNEEDDKRNQEFLQNN